MSWFKRRSDSKNSQRSDTSSLNSEGSLVERRSRRDTDPETCLEVFRNHWQQADLIISRDVKGDSKSTVDEIEAVSQNFEQMVTLLSDEEGVDGQGMPGPILHYLLEHEILEKFCGWCHRNNDVTGKLTKEQLRMFEHLISHSNQLLLIHKPVIRPLLNLLAYCADDCSSDIEPNLVLVLHQICISISKETVILESFFNMNADHGPTKFLIFSLLVPFLHREGSVGQQARDALLLIMALSSKHPYIGEYISENSDFCPVLATGLSGLYSDLPRKIEIPTEDWLRLADEDVQKMPEMSMFLNSLEFCNAVVQIAHPLVRDQLIKFIYNGFLVPVLGPALHQDISGLPTPLLDSPMFANSREEVITATAYLDLFLRKVTEPSLVRAFLKFIFTEKNDEIIILESLITRLNSSSRLCLVSLSLFHTLVDLNCEDVMFDLVFKHLIPCTHVMVSQRRSVRDLDMYSKSAEKFLSLRPTCCLPEIDSPKHGVVELPGLPPLSASNQRRKGLPKFLQSRKGRNNRLEIVSEPRLEPTAFPPGTVGSKLDHFETSYLEYLHDANISMQKCSLACRSWQYQYDGQNPSPSSVCVGSNASSGSGDGTGPVIPGRDPNLVSTSKEVSKRVVVDEPCDQQDGVKMDVTVGEGSRKCDSSKLDNVIISSEGSAIGVNDIVVGVSNALTEASKRVKYANDEEFMSMLEESESPVDKSVNFEESLKSLEKVLSAVSSKTDIRTSTPRKDSNTENENANASDNHGNETELSTVYYDCESSADETGLEQFKSINDTSIEDVSNQASKVTNTTDNKVNSSENKSKNAIADRDNEIIEIESSDRSGFEMVDTHFADDSEKENRDSSSSVNNSVSNSPERSKPGNKRRGSDSILKGSYKTADGILVKKAAGFSPDAGRQESQGGTKGDKSVRFDGSVKQQSTEAPTRPVSGVGLAMYKQGGSSPSVGPFLTALLLKLEGMLQNTFPVNLMLTGLVSRLAAYSQPLIRSYLLNHNLVFQPTVKSLVQVLTSVRQKVDHYSYTVQNFEALLLRARRTLAQREGLLPERDHSLSPSPELVHSKPRATTLAEIPSKEKRHRTLSELLFRRPPNDRRPTTPSNALRPGSKNAKLEILAGNKGMRFVNRRPEERRENHMESTKTKNAVYCAIVLEEFVKELAALSQEHAVLYLEYDSSLPRS